MAEAFGGTVGGALGGGLFARILRRRRDRLRAAGAVECGFRDRTGTWSPLLKRWRSGYARIEPGLICFEPFLPLGFRMRRPWTDPIRIQVNAVSREHREAHGLETWYFRGHVFEINTGTVTIEWGLEPLNSTWAIEVVLPTRLA